MTKLQELIFIGLTAAGLSLAVSAVSANQGECRKRGLIQHSQAMMQPYQTRPDATITSVRPRLVWMGVDIVC